MRQLNITGVEVCRRELEILISQAYISTALTSTHDYILMKIPLIPAIMKVSAFYCITVGLYSVYVRGHRTL